MKKNLIVLLLASFFTLASCSSDDDAAPKSYSVVGTWNLTAMNPSFYDLNDCPEKPVISFNDDETADWTYYDPNNSCAESKDSGTWTQDSATEYTIFVPNFGSLSGTVTFSSATKFTFSGSTNDIPFTLTFEQ